MLIFLATDYVPLFEIIGRAGIDSALGPFLGFASLFTGLVVGFLSHNFGISG